jgi:hypothetical protein
MPCNRGQLAGAMPQGEGQTHTCCVTMTRTFSNAGHRRMTVRTAWRKSARMAGSLSAWRMAWDSDDGMPRGEKIDALSSSFNKTFVLVTVRPFCAVLE